MKSEAFPLGGIRVLELAGGTCAATAGKILTETGAEVMLVEPPGGAALRQWRASAELDGGDPLAPGDTGALFNCLHASKQGTTLDLSTDPDRAAFEALLAQADLLLEDGQLASVGLSAQELLAKHPQLSIISISDWGDKGPWSGRPATEFTLQAEVGATAYRGYPDRAPFAAGGHIGDHICGVFAAVAAMAALRMPPGRRVEVSRFEAMLLSFQPYQYLHGQLEPDTPMPASVDVPSIEPANDGWVGLCTITEKQWRSFAEMIGRPDLGEDPTLRTGFMRFQHIDRVQPAIHAWTQRHSVAQIIEEAERRRIPVAPVGDGATVLDMAQFVARKSFWRHPDQHQQPRPPYRLGKGRLRRPGTAPRRGSQSTDWTPRDKAPQRDATLPMQGLRVLDLTAFWAGPVAGACFALFGAEVIKVESTQHPDGMRFAAGFFPKDKPLWECSPITHGANTGKLGITLDLNDSRGLAAIKKLIAKCDVVIENFSPRVMQQFGLDWTQISALNPEAVMVRMPAFGLEGPWRHRTGFAMTIEQVSGLAWQTGYPDRSPVVPRGCVDPLGGMHAVIATLAALRLRDGGAGGQLVEVALAEAGLYAVSEQIAEYTAYGSRLGRHGNRSPHAVPQGVFSCRAGAEIAVAVETDAQWQALARLLGKGFAEAVALANRAGRRAEETRIETAVAQWCASQDAAEALDTLLAAGVPAAVLRNVRELQHHPQLRANGFFTRLQHAVAGELDYPNFPFQFDGQRFPLRTPAPMLGEHNAQVLGELAGLQPDELEQLQTAGVIGTRPAFVP